MSSIPYPLSVLFPRCSISAPTTPITSKGTTQKFKLVQNHFFFQSQSCTAAPVLRPPAHSGGYESESSVHCNPKRRLNFSLPSKPDSLDPKPAMAVTVRHQQRRVPLQRNPLQRSWPESSHILLSVQRGAAVVASTPVSSFAVFDKCPRNSVTAPNSSTMTDKKQALAHHTPQKRPVFLDFTPKRKKGSRSTQMLSLAQKNKKSSSPAHPKQKRPNSLDLSQKTKKENAAQLSAQKAKTQSPPYVQHKRPNSLDLTPKRKKEKRNARRPQKQVDSTGFAGAKFSDSPKAKTVPMPPPVWSQEIVSSSSSSLSSVDLSIPSVPKNEEKETEKHAVPSAVTQSPMSLRTPGKCRSSVRMSSLSSLRMSPLQLIAAVAST